MSREANVMMLALLGALLALITAPAVAGTGNASHRVTGKVVAIVTEQSPRTIVLRAMSVTGELIVGATVGERIPIRRGTKPIRFDQLRIGETVQLTYQKTTAGLVALSIAANSATSAGTQP